MDVYSEIEIEVLVEENQAAENAIDNTAYAQGDDSDLTNMLEALVAVTNSTQTFDTYDEAWNPPMENNTVTDIASDWLHDFLSETEQEADSKANYTIDDTGEEDEPGPGDEIISWGTRIAIYGGSIGDYFGIGDTAIAGFDGDANTGTDGTSGDNVVDEVIAVGTQTTFDRPDVFILRGSNGTFSFHHRGQVFNNEGDWLNSLYDELMSIVENNTPIIGRPVAPFPIPGMSLDIFESLPVDVRRSVLEHFIGRLPVPG